MNKGHPLSRQVLAFMISLTLTVIAVSVIGSYLFYTFIIYYIPGGAMAGNEDQMTYLDWLWILIASAISLSISLFFTVKLSARILTPLSSVATSLRRIAQGDLGARAFCASSHLGELNHLVNDFNEMAEKLQTMDAQRRSWNAAIAHELRTPVTILRGRLQGLVDGVFEPNPTLFNNLLKQTEGLSSLIEDLRVVSSSGGAEFTLTLAEVDLQEIIQSAVDSFALEFKRSHFTVATELHPQQCQCDPLRIIQCLTVLFDNAIKYATSKSMVIRHGANEHENFILIEDGGPGIPEAFHKFMFHPFQRGASARDTNPEGCGLGLSVLKAIMLAHQGDVTYTLTDQGHSIFRLSWPLRKQP
ncbi:ATP-binding protein [Kosakonia sacchari]